jgi:hypothetical protein
MTAPPRSPPLLACLLVLAAVAAAADQGPSTSLHHDIVLRLDPTTRALAVEDRLSLPGPGGIEVRLDPRFVVETLTLDGGTAGVAALAPGRWRVEPGSRGATRTLFVRYRGTLEPLPRADHRGVLRRLPPMADPAGSYLPAGGGWYPEVRGRLFRYRLSLALPPGQRGLAPGRLLVERQAPGGTTAVFTSEQAGEDLSLMAGPYRVEERGMRLPTGEAVRLRAYLHPEVADLADPYLDASQQYLERYSRSIGPYPFGGFSVVSSPLPTGFGMPTLTYLGLDVLRLPFIRGTSLGHEVLHNWWGNGVYVGPGGNWAEGLTTFLADYAYAEERGAAAARDLRLAWLRDFAAVPAGQDTPLAHFTARTHGTSQVVGYHKAAFLFLMLRDRIGAAAFDEGLRRFWRSQRGRAAGWPDLRRAFEDAAGVGLEDFFEQWLVRRGAPAVQVERATWEAAGPGARLRIVLAQGEPPYALDVPVSVVTERGTEQAVLPLRRPRQELTLDLPAPPTAAALDPELRLFRRLAPGEAPAILRQAMLNPATMVVSVSGDAGLSALAAQLAGRLLDHPVRLAPAERPLPDVPVLVIGLRPDVDRFLARRGLPARPEAVAGKGTAQVWAAYRASGRPVVAVSAETAESLRDLLGPLPHYGRESYLAFQGPRVIVRGSWPPEPVTVAPAPAGDPSATPHSGKNPVDSAR